MDFGELPVFEAAATDAAIFLWRKEPRGSSPTAWAMIELDPDTLATVELLV